LHFFQAIRCRREIAAGEKVPGEKRKIGVAAERAWRDGFYNRRNRTRLTA